MEHEAQLVAILNEQGEVVSSKPRRHIDKVKDIFHTVFVFIVTPFGELVLTKIPEKKNLPNLYVGKIGIPVAAIRRTDETAEAAAIRACARELFIDHSKVNFIGQEFMAFEREKRLISAFFVIAEPPKEYSTADLEGIIVMSPNELRKRLHREPEAFSPTLRKIWREFGGRLPV